MVPKLSVSSKNVDSTTDDGRKKLSGSDREGLVVSEV